MRSKRGQFTLFVILGIVLIAAFAFLLFVRSIFVDIELASEQRTSYTELLETSPIQYRVASCLDSVTEEGLYLLGKQGGVIYDFQGGNTTFGTSFSEQTWIPYGTNSSNVNFVHYGILQQQNIGCVDTVPPGYPYPETYLLYRSGLTGTNYARYVYLGLVGNTCPDRQPPLSGAFGSNALPRLCSPTGPNRLGITNLSTISCFPLHIGVPNIQDEFAYYIQQNISGCVDFESYAVNTSHNISVLDDPNVTITFGSEGFIVEIDYPIIIYLYGREPVVSFIKFQRSYDVRLKETYELVNEIIMKDVQNPDFNSSNVPSEPMFFWSPDFYVSRLANACSQLPAYCLFRQKDDIIKVVDSLSMVRGAPFTFQFAVRNRLPALEYMHGHHSTYDIVILENETLLLTPVGYDPDERIVNYTYSGWKETEDAIFLIAQCEANASDCLLNPENYVQIIPGVAPENWTNSPEYLATEQNASYDSNINDAGVHYVIVNISKEGGLYDYQNVSILIYDLPQASFTGSNPYPNAVNPDIASIEDPYYFDASSSTASMLLGSQNASTYFWHDLTERWQRSTVNPLLTVPLLPSTDNITSNEFRLGFENQQHTVRLQIQDITASNSTIMSEPFDADVYVSECISLLGNNPPIYPYGPAFFNDHSCCLNDLFKSETKSCWNESQYTCRPEPIIYSPGDFVVTDDGYGGLSPSPTGVTFDWTTGDANDIYLRTFQQNCSGNRGNACAGAAIDYWRVQDNCSANSCKAPCDPNDSRCNFDQCQVLDSPRNCSGMYNYSAGSNFDYNFLRLPSATQACDPTPKCADFEGGSYGTNSQFPKFVCQGGCDGKGNCAEAWNCNPCPDDTKIYCRNPGTNDVLRGKREGYCDASASCDKHFVQYNSLSCPTGSCCLASASQGSVCHDPCSAAYDDQCVLPVCGGAAPSCDLNTRDGDPCTADLTYIPGFCVAGYCTPP